MRGSPFRPSFFGSTVVTFSSLACASVSCDESFISCGFSSFTFGDEVCDCALLLIIAIWSEGGSQLYRHEFQNFYFLWITNYRDNFGSAAVTEYFSSSQACVAAERGDVGSKRVFPFPVFDFPLNQ
mmetsp:Transcript_21588/g.31615  ORF Transcript_21588/g.31615 Transcript_21588/m.31615 type:complete len:126 (-) Transcript_21588:108-485(-)